MVVKSQRPGRRYRVEDQGITVGNGYGVTSAGGNALGGSHGERCGAVVRGVGVDRQARKKWRSAIDYDRRVEIWRGDKADIRLREDVVVVIVKIDTPDGIGFRNRSVETVAAIVLQQADIRAGIAGFQDANSRSHIDPVCRLVTSTEAVIL